MSSSKIISKKFCFILHSILYYVVCHFYFRKAKVTFNLHCQLISPSVRVFLKFYVWRLLVMTVCINFTLFTLNFWLCVLITCGSKFYVLYGLLYFFSLRVRLKICIIIIIIFIKTYSTARNNLTTAHTVI